MFLFHHRQNGDKQAEIFYFDNPKTEEDLNNQYRRLLIQFDFQAAKNSDILKDIQYEYSSVLLALRHASQTA